MSALHSTNERLKRHHRHRRISLLITVSFGAFLLVVVWVDAVKGVRDVYQLQSQQQHVTDGPNDHSDVFRERRDANSIDGVVEILMDLAQKAPSDLWNVFGMDASSSSDHGVDPFQLQALEKGECPWSSTDELPHWLPLRPLNSQSLSETYKSTNQSPDSKRNEKVHKEESAYDPSNHVIVWYEHISKSGGTTFCALANRNMLPSSVPKYHCMPSKGEKRDGRVGTWGNDELMEYSRSNQHNIVANEWDSFPIDKLQFSGRGDDTADEKDGPRLLFVTTLRDPADRLLCEF
jgi:hypothetical protein